MKMLAYSLIILTLTVLRDGQSKTIKESYSCRNSVTNEVCVDHQLDCEQGKEIYVLNGRYMYSKTETNCSNLLNGKCMMDNRSYCSRDYIVPVMNEVSSECNGLRSCRPPTPKGVSGLYCVKLDEFRFPTFYRLYTLSYLSYTCISDVDSTSNPNPESTSNPKQTPNDESTPNPTHNPNPTPTPHPYPTPYPESTSNPNPTPNPDPEPTPNPYPEPTANPTPTPYPNPTPDPDPTPNPNPTSNPNPEPSPIPYPEQSLTPYPYPESTHNPNPNPNPGSTPPTTWDPLTKSDGNKIETLFNTTGQSGNETTIKESYSCRNSVTNDVCVGHQLDCEQGEEIYVLNGQYMYSTTETNCNNLLNGICMVDNRSYCSRDYIESVMDEVSSECNGLRSCRPPTPNGVSGLNCVKWNQFRFPTFHRLYTLSYLSYTCISAPKILKIDENIGRTKTINSSHVVVMGDVTPNTICSLRVDHSVDFVFSQSNKENSTLLYYRQWLRPLHRYIVKVRDKYFKYFQHYFKLSFRGPLTDLKINLTTIGRPTRELDVTTHCWTETVTTTSRSPNPEPGPTSEPTHNPTPYRKTTTSSPLSTSTPFIPTTSNGLGNTDGKTPPSFSNGWGYTSGKAPLSTSNGWGNTDGRTPPSTSNGWGYTDGKRPPGTTEPSDNQPTDAPSLQWNTALLVGIVAFSALVIFLPVIAVILRL